MSFPNPSTESTAEEVAEFYARHIKDKIILTTGVSPGGLGAYFAQTIAAHKPKLLILAARSLSKLQETASTISKAHPDVQTRVLVLDLGDLKQVWKAAKEVLAYPEEEIDVINSAAVMACPYSTTTDGLEMQFGTGHVGHFLFTNLILEKVLKAKGRVVNVASDGHRLSPVHFDDPGFDGGKAYNRWLAYGQAKSANMLFSVGLAEKFGSKGLTSFSLHPGVIATNLGRHIDEEEVNELVALDRKLGNYEGEREGFTFLTHSQGTSTYVFAAFNQSIAEHNGAYLLEVRLAKPEEIRNKATDKEQAERLWKLSNEIVGQEF